MAHTVDKVDKSRRTVHTASHAAHKVVTNLTTVRRKRRRTVLGDNRLRSMSRGAFSGHSGRSHTSRPSARRNRPVIGYAATPTASSEVARYGEAGRSVIPISLLRFG